MPGRHGSESPWGLLCFVARLPSCAYFGGWARRQPRRRRRRFATSKVLEDGAFRPMCKRRYAMLLVKLTHSLASHSPWRLAVTSGFHG